MKKRRIVSNLIVIFTLVAVIPVSAGNGKNRILNGGFSFNCIIGFVPNNYAFAQDVATPERELGILIGGEIGNRFYTPLNEKFAFGAMINWIEIAVTQKKSAGSVDWLSDPIIDIAFLKLDQY